MSRTRKEKHQSGFLSSTCCSGNIVSGVYQPGWNQNIQAWVK